MIANGIEEEAAPPREREGMEKGPIISGALEEAVRAAVD